MNEVQILGLCILGVLFFIVCVIVFCASNGCKHDVRYVGNSQKYDENRNEYYYIRRYHCFKCKMTKYIDTRHGDPYSGH